MTLSLPPVLTLRHIALLGGCCTLAIARRYQPRYTIHLSAYMYTVTTELNDTKRLVNLSTHHVNMISGLYETKNSTKREIRKLKKCILSALFRRVLITFL